MTAGVRETVRLYSEQGMDLRIFNGRMDPIRGTYAGQSRISAAQSRLYAEVVGTDQVVWSCLAAPEPIPLDFPQYVHMIDADRRDIAAILDGFVWEHIIGNDRCVPPEDHERMRFACCISADDKHTHLRRLEDEYIAAHLPKDPWSKVLAADIECRMPQVLLRWPFKHSHIAGVETIVREQRRGPYAL
jgi:hypothetical protein